MTPSQKIVRARKCFQLWLQDQPSPAEESETLPFSPRELTRESVLICDGFYQGMRFHGETGDATWFLEEDELKIQDLDGAHVLTLSSEEMQLRVGQATDHDEDTVRRAA